MKFLVLSRLRTDAPVPRDALILYQAAVEWLDSALKNGQLDCVYQRVGGGGVAIVNAYSAEELWEGIAAYPLTAQLEFQVEPLVDIDHAFARVDEMLMRTHE